jgi:hypothetical protein
MSLDYAISWTLGPLPSMISMNGESSQHTGKYHADDARFFPRVCTTALGEI